MIVLLLIFAVLPSQVKLKISLLILSAKCSGMDKTDVPYISLVTPRVFHDFYSTVKTLGVAKLIYGTALVYVVTYTGNFLRVTS